MRNVTELSFRQQGNVEKIWSDAQIYLRIDNFSVTKRVLVEVMTNWNTSDGLALRNWFKTKVTFNSSKSVTAMIATKQKLLHQHFSIKIMQIEKRKAPTAVDGWTTFHYHEKNFRQPGHTFSQFLPFFLCFEQI